VNSLPSSRMGAVSHSQEKLESISVSARLGVGKLHAPRSQQRLNLYATKGGSHTKHFPVKNAGNITVDVLFSTLKYQDVLAVTPSNTVLEPGEKVEIAVRFKPNVNVMDGEEYLTDVVMAIMPDGPQFECKLRAVVGENPEEQQQQKSHNNNVSRASTSSSTTTISSRYDSSLKQGSDSSSGRSAPELFTNKTQLSWGGVKCAANMKQTLMLRAGPKEKDAFKFRVTLKGAHTSAFQVVHDEAGTDELVTQCDMSFKIGSDKPISVMFTPSQKKVYNAVLEIRTPADHPVTKYSIPLLGYGCTSSVYVEGLMGSNTHPKVKPLHNGHLPAVKRLQLKQYSSNSEFLVVNGGQRSAFVKIVAYSGTDSGAINPHVICQPSEFVLGVGHSKCVKFCVPTTTTTSAVVKDGRSSAAVAARICIWHGDELSRRLLKAATKTRNSLPRAVANSPWLKSTSFSQDFQCQDNIDEEDLIGNKPHANDVNTFYKT